jgi:hypothetical protein
VQASDFSDLWNDDSQSVTVVHRVPGTFDPATQTGTADTETLEVTRGILRGYEQRLINDQTVQPNDRRALLDPAGLTSMPDTTDQLEIASVRFQIVRVRTFAPGLEVFAYDCQVRGL